MHTSRFTWDKTDCLEQQITCYFFLGISAALSGECTNITTKKKHHVLFLLQLEIVYCISKGPLAQGWSLQWAQLGCSVRYLGWKYTALCKHLLRLHFRQFQWLQPQSAFQYTHVKPQQSAAAFTTMNCALNLISLRYVF